MSSTESKLKTLAANIRKDPDDSFSKFALALEFLKIERPDKARVLFESIYRNDPGYTGTYYHLGKLYEHSGLGKKALTLYTEGIDVARRNNETRTVSELKEAREQLKMEMKQR